MKLFEQEEDGRDGSSLHRVSSGKDDDEDWEECLTRFGIFFNLVSKEEVDGRELDEVFCQERVWVQGGPLHVRVRSPDAGMPVWVQGGLECGKATDSE